MDFLRLSYILATYFQKALHIYFLPPPNFVSFGVTYSDEIHWFWQARNLE